jgi:hypothetical protein
MHYVTRRTHRMQKHKFCIMCPSADLIEITPGLLEHENCCVDISHPGLTKVPNVTRRFHFMQKHNFGVTCPDPLFMETTLSPTGHEK